MRKSANCTERFRYGIQLVESTSEEEFSGVAELPGIRTLWSRRPAKCQVFELSAGEWLETSTKSAETETTPENIAGANQHGAQERGVGYGIWLANSLLRDRHGSEEDSIVAGAAEAENESESEKAGEREAEAYEIEKAVGPKYAVRRLFFPLPPTFAPRRKKRLQHDM